MSFVRTIHLLIGGSCVALFIVAQLYLGWKLAIGASHGKLYVGVIVVIAGMAALTKIAAHMRHDH